MPDQDRSTVGHGVLSSSRAQAFPIGATITQADLDRDPYEVATRLRSCEPVTWADQLGMWLVVNRADVERVLRDTATFSSVHDDSPVMATFGDQMLNADGEDHKRQRDPCAWPFRPRSVQDHWSQTVESHVDDLLDELVANAQGRRAEVRLGLARPLVVRVIRDVIGLDASEQELDRWYDDFALALADFEGRPEIRTAARASVAALHESLLPVLEGDLETLDGTLLDSLCQKSLLDNGEIFRNVLITLFGAVETTESLICNAIWLLHQRERAGHWSGLEDAALRVAIEETTRVEPAVQTLTRFTTTPVEIGGVEVGAHEVVQCLIAGANHDPSVYERPEELVVDREGPRHLGYGYGVHYCLGADLARLEARTVVRGLGERLPEATVDLEASRAPWGAEFRKPEQLWLRW